MLDVALHTGQGHPNLIWILVPSVLSFVVGLGIGSSSNVIREWLFAPSDNAGD